ncbi:MAG: hypothetical protein ACOZQL_37170 [Myxococcota bacterium]
MKLSRLRAPFHVLEEVLGDADEDPDMDKSSTLFLYVFEGETMAVFDFHKPEWGGPPECRTSRDSVWTVDGEDHDVGRFCTWLSAEVMKRVPGDAYRWPLPGEPAPTPPPPPKPAVRAVAPKVRPREGRAPTPPALDAHRRRVLAFQSALDDRDALSLSELRADLRRLSAEAQALAALLAQEPELPEAAVRERVGRGFERACAELDSLLRAWR